MSVRRSMIPSPPPVLAAPAVSVALPSLTSSPPHLLTFSRSHALLTHHTLSSLSPHSPHALLTHHTLSSLSSRSPYSPHALLTLSSLTSRSPHSPRALLTLSLLTIHACAPPSARADPCTEDPIPHMCIRMHMYRGNPHMHIPTCVCIHVCMQLSPSNSPPHERIAATLKNPTELHRRALVN